MLANPRYWGVGFNPVSFYFLHGARRRAGRGDDRRGHEHPLEGAPQLRARPPAPGGLTGEFEKLMHVSPFMPMEQRYEWSATEPGERLNVSIRNRQEGRIVFEAGPRARAPRDDTGGDAGDTVPVSAHDGLDHRSDLLERRPAEAKGAPYFQRPERPSQDPRGGLMQPGVGPMAPHRPCGPAPDRGRARSSSRSASRAARPASSAPPRSPRRARIVVHDPGVYGKLARSKSIAFGQTYAERGWDTDDLPTLLRIVARDIGRADPLRRRIAPLLVPFQRLGTLRMLNTRARRAIEHRPATTTSATRCSSSSSTARR